MMLVLQRGHPSCGADLATKERITEDVAGVTCRRCLRTREWRDAWQAAHGGADAME